MCVHPHAFALCADDFGLSADISNAIIELVQKQRITSVSCITNAENFHLAARLLQPFTTGIELGLHFNLTEGKPLSTSLNRYWPSLPSIKKLILTTHLGAIPCAALEEELQAQWLAFYSAFGKEPDFIDGHQHVHDLPAVRDIVLARACAQAAPPWLRNTGAIAGAGYTFKRRVIELTGGIRLLQQLKKSPLHYNSVLLGVYDFSDINYRALMRAWLARLPENRGLIFCHPGFTGTGAKKHSMAHARAAEYDYFNSDAFLDDLRTANVFLQPLSKQLPVG